MAWFAVGNLIVWLLIGLFHNSANHRDILKLKPDHAWTDELLLYLIGYGIFMLIGPVLFWLVGKQLQKSRPLLHNIAITVVNTVIFSLLYIPLAALYFNTAFDLNMRHPLELFNHLAMFNWFMDSMLFLVLYGMCISSYLFLANRQKRKEALTLERNNARLQLQVRDLKMHVIQQQLEPHFLFNALNSISALIQLDDRKRALPAISLLSRLLRHTIEGGKEPLVTLSDELEFIKAYIDLQQLRYGDRLQYQLEIDNDVDGFLIPPGILQPLLENAVKHTLDQGMESVTILIKVSALMGERYQVIVRNDHQSDQISDKEPGIGQEIVKQRLTLTYQDNFDMKVQSVNNQYSILLTLPTRSNL